MATTTLRFLLDATDIEEADDDNTTHFGGTYTIDGVEKRGYGDDRSNSYHDDIVDHVIAKCQAKWSELQDTGAFSPLVDVEEDVQSVVHEIVDDGPVGTILVTRQDNGIFLVTRE